MSTTSRACATSGTDWRPNGLNGRSTYRRTALRTYAGAYRRAYGPRRGSRRADGHAQDLRRADGHAQDLRRADGHAQGFRHGLRHAGSRAYGLRSGSCRGLRRVSRHAYDAYRRMQATHRGVRKTRSRLRTPQPYTRRAAGRTGPRTEPEP
ncbi:hypothetical protein Srubr_61250 [Streptomyces rubradiris]|uniref:Uncharacterized protein n=1 Tax=Streptomyces rubradiris TaxID=285531 RepID=A0ABQ3RK82_STRRR|nr:hypothetical protein GCM10018792_61860 [Streptomyces rubradiris]GHI56279.1 hypothetical protein Srubr_61250 [Streptomyces rubradiris]